MGFWCLTAEDGFSFSPYNPEVKMISEFTSTALLCIQIPSFLKENT
jgi:hypothetical protein